MRSGYCEGGGLMRNKAAVAFLVSDMRTSVAVKFIKF